jgi:hypothetical protein
MTSQIASIIRELEHRKAAIVKALDALAEIDGGTAGPSASDSIPASGRNGRRRSAATRRKMRLAALARYASKRAEADKVSF